MPVRYIDEVGALYESKIGNLQQLEQDTSDLSQTGPEAADGFEPVDVDPKNKKRENSTLDEDKFSNNVEEKEEKAVKKEQKEINNSTMRQNSNKSSFDKLFEDVMGDDVPMDMGIGGEEGAPPIAGDEEGAEEEGGLVTLELDRELAEALHSALDGVLGGEDEGDIEDIEDIDDSEGQELAPESHVDLQAGPGDAVSKLAGQNNKVGGDATPAGGSADSGGSGQEDGGKPKPAHDSVAALTGKNNKVGGKLTGGNKHAFKA